MRIGLLTYHWVANYGANLQALSTYCFLEKQGFNPIIINWVPEDAWNCYIQEASLEQIKVHNDFISRNCRLTRKFSDQSELQEIANEEGITHVIIGSDALFNIIKPHIHPLKMKYSQPTADHCYPNIYWGLNMDNLPHAGLSISSQNARYFEFFLKRKEIGNFLGRFKLITVRDNWTRDMVSFFTHGSIIPQITPDPVFSFNANISDIPKKEDIRRKYCLDEHYVLVSFEKNPYYAASSEWVEELNALFNGIGVQLVNMPRPTGGQEFSTFKQIQMPIDPMDWYCLIKYSYAYIGILMHPIVVALHNSVPFFSFDGYGISLGLYKNIRSSKIYHILNKAQLQEYYTSMIMDNTFPPAAEVFKKIQSFPKERCSEFSKKMEKECIDNYNNIIESLF